MADHSKLLNGLERDVAPGAFTGHFLSKKQMPEVENLAEPGHGLTGSPGLSGQAPNNLEHQPL
jgi:hypothetical protein